ncbi:MAG: hypothetical protein JWO05_605 [Gemmatimonadetes bacterium]|nr:hypothetical protein [Gemmatimonadota bacterium]
MYADDAWHTEREELLGRRISELGLSLRGSRLELLVEQLHQELRSRGIAFMPPAYLTDQWGCPDGTPIIGVPFYLADARLERIEAEMSGAVEGDVESMRYLRHEAGHALNYALRLYDDPEWQVQFGRFDAPYADRYEPDPFSRAYVRHILGWYAQKHPDEDFAETFAVWLTPGFDWREEYANWPVLAKLEYVDRVMAARGAESPTVPEPAEDDLPVEAMGYTLLEHYDADPERLPAGDERHFDSDLRRIFASAADAPECEEASLFLRRHTTEMMSRLGYWTGEPPTVIRSVLDLLARRASTMGLRASGLEASTLVELTAFMTTVLMHHRHTQLSSARQ